MSGILIWRFSMFERRIQRRCSDMDFLKDNIRTLFFRLLFPSIVSAVVMSIYSFVDTIAVGQSEGVLGTGAMAVIAPIYGIKGYETIMN